MSVRDVYRMYDANGVLLYIGCSYNLTLRLPQHRRQRPWWDDIASITLEHYDDHASAYRAEAAAIAAEKPLHNGTLAPWEVSRRAREARA